MNLIKTTITLMLVAIFMLPAQAQFMNKLKRAVGNTLEDHAVRQINKGLSKALTKAEDKMWESMFGVKKSAMDSMIIASQEDPETYQKMMESLYGGNAVPVADTYTFESRYVYKLTQESGKKTNSSDYVLLTNPNEEYMATQLSSMEMDGKKTDNKTKVTSIMDYGNNAMIMIMEEQNMAHVMSMNFLTSMDSSEYIDNNVKIEKTGKTKKILGYTCDEYYMHSDDAEGSVWIAEDVDFVSSSLFDNMGKSSFARNSDWLDEKGMMMETHMMVREDKKNKKSRITMTMIAMDKEQKAYTMADYQTMNFGGAASKE